MFKEETTTSTFIDFRFFSPETKTALMERSFAWSVGSYQKSKVQVLLYLVKNYGAFVTCVYIELKFGLLQPTVTIIAKNGLDCNLHANMEWLVYLSPYEEGIAQNAPRLIVRSKVGSAFEVNMHC